MLDSALRAALRGSGAILVSLLALALSGKGVQSWQKKGGSLRQRGNVERSASIDRVFRELNLRANRSCSGSRSLPS